MEEELITKKELLELTGISYGALYRWKRKKLIPDDWFIHRATFTGQETFFPREKILQRVEKIKQLKDDMSLDDIAETFSPSLREIQLSGADAERYGIASRALLELYIEKRNNSGPFDFEGLFEIFLFDRLLKTGNLGREDAFSALELVKEGRQRNKENPGLLMVFRKLGVTVQLLVQETAVIQSEPEVKVVFTVSIGQMLSELKHLLDLHNSNQTQSVK